MKKTNNNGFSLVELIIVIAIMAVLIGVLAPQFLKYVERSRNSTDVQNAQEIVTALQTYAADPEATVVPASGSLTFGASVSTPNDFAKAALIDAGLADASGNVATRCKSKTAWDSYTVSWTVDANGTILFTYSSKKGNADTTAFTDLMAGKTKAE